MSSEYSINKEASTLDQAPNYVINNHDKASRVNINDLLFKVRKKEQKKRKENLILFSLFGSIVVISGIIASL